MVLATRVLRTVLVGVVATEAVRFRSRHGKLRIKAYLLHAGENGQPECDVSMAQWVRLSSGGLAFQSPAIFNFIMGFLVVDSNPQVGSGGGALAAQFASSPQRAHWGALTCKAAVDL